MSFFSKKPIRRLFFVFVYIVSAIWLIKDFAWFNLLFSLIMVFGGYIAIIKSKILKDKYANAIDDYKFDLFSISLTVVLLAEIIFQ